MIKRMAKNVSFLLSRNLGEASRVRVKKGCFRKWAPILPSDRDIALAKEDIKVSTSAALGCANTIEILTEEKVHTTEYQKNCT